MVSYKYLMPSAIFAGDDVICKKAHIMAQLGKRAYIISYEMANGAENECLKDTIKALESQGVEYRVTLSSVPNPTIESIDAIANDAYDFKPDFLIACGGGSPIDTAKAVSVLLGRHGEDPFEVLYNTYPTAIGSGASGSVAHNESILGFGDGVVPIITIPTTAGTGAEITPVGVLTNERVGSKMSMQQRVFATITFLDAKYVKSCPPSLMHATALDALTHGVEAYLNTYGNFMSQAYAKLGFEFFSKFKDRLPNLDLTTEDYENMLIAANVFGFGEMYSTTITHGMGYPLTEEKGVSHGLACAVFLGEFLRNFKDQSLIKPILDGCGFNNVDEFADYINGILQPYIHFTCTMKEIEEWTEMMITGSQKWRIPKNPEPITREDIINIYVRSLKNAIVG